MRLLSRKEGVMEPILERVCGSDVGPATVVACLFIGRAEQKARKEIRTFPTVTRELLKLRDWLLGREVLT